MDEETRLPLAEVLKVVATELRKAHDAAKDDPVMQFKECEIEFAVETTGKAGMGIQIYVVKLGGGISKTESNTIKVKYVALKDGGLTAEGGAAPGTIRKPRRRGKRVSK